MKTKVKLGYVVGCYPSISETFILREIAALKARGCDITVFSYCRPAGSRIHPENTRLDVRTIYRAHPLSWTSISARLHFLLRIPATMLRTGPPSVLTSTNPLRTLVRFFTAAQFARVAVEEGITHIHAHFAFAPAEVARMMASIMGIGYSVSVHARDIFAQNRSQVAKSLLNAQFVTTCTNMGTERLKAMLPDLPVEKTHLVRHGISPGEFTTARSPCVIQRGRQTGPTTGGESAPVGRVSDPASPLRILAVGRLEKKKGFVSLVEACTALRDKRIRFGCTIAGEGPERKTIEEAIQRLGLAGLVTLSGELTQDELVKLYSASSVFVMPSVIATDGDRDGLPNVILEAMAMQLPVVATTASAVSEAVTDGLQGFIIEPASPEMLADKISQLLADPDLRRKMGEKGRETVLKEFDISANIVKLADLF